MDMDIFHTISLLLLFAFQRSDGSHMVIGVGGTIETHGSIFDMPNQQVYLDDTTINVTIDLPSLITCQVFHYGNTASYFCPDPFLYYRWITLFKLLLQKHSVIKIKHFPHRKDIDPRKMSVLQFDCPEEGTVLTYGDGRCQIEGAMFGLIHSEHNMPGCQRLVPMILPGKARIVSRQLYVWTGQGMWKNFYLPCVSPMYICGYGEPSNIHSIGQREVPVAAPYKLKDILNVDYHHVFLRDAKFDCLQSQEFSQTFEHIKTCIFKRPTMNTTEFNLRVQQLQSNNLDNQTRACLDKGVCTQEYSIIGGQNRDGIRNICPTNLDEEIIAVNASYYHPFNQKHLHMGQNLPETVLQYLQPKFLETDAQDINMAIETKVQTHTQPHVTTSHQGDIESSTKSTTEMERAESQCTEYNGDTFSLLQQISYDLKSVKKSNIIILVILFVIGCLFIIQAIIFKARVYFVKRTSTTSEKNEHNYMVVV